MRESNFAFPGQNRACVCITAQLYDRRALDTTSSLPLFNSLTHLTYLTSTSPRIREIMTLDGGLERLVRLLHAFCLSPPPPENPAVLYGLSPPTARPARPPPTLNPAVFDKHAAYRFSLAFQCLVNIGVRGSEDIRGRVVQAGTLEVVGCVLEAWLAGKGFAVGPSSSATGMPRETREQRMERRKIQAEMRQREEAAELARALQRQIAVEGGRGRATMDDPPSASTATDSAGASDADTSTDTSTNATPVRSGTPTGTVLVPGRERSGTVVAQPVWDQPPATATNAAHAGHGTIRASHRRTFHRSPDTSQPNTETEDDGDVDMDRAPPSPTPGPRARRAVGIVSDVPPAAPLDTPDAHIIINDAGMGVEDGIVSLEPNDDFAMGAPPGAPGAIEEGAMMRRDGTIRARGAGMGGAGADATPRAGPTDLPLAGATPMRRDTGVTLTPATARPTRHNTAMPAATTAVPTHTHAHAAAPRHRDEGPYRDEDVLLSMQLLAYLSKYPHVRQAFYKSRSTFHPASGAVSVAAAAGGSKGVGSGGVKGAKEGKESKDGKEGGFFRAFSTNRGKEKEKEKEKDKSTTGSTSAPSSSASTTVTTPAATPAPPTIVPSQRQTNVFSLVERFTFRPSSTETDLPNPPPKLPPEIQYWAGVIMRNACRKDDSRGGIRQCANMLCGKWETYPREFAKCRRCRKAKYCGKECQSTAWSEGHRFWCSVKEGDEEALGEHNIPGVHVDVPVEVEVEGDADPRAERRAERERERAERERIFQAGNRPTREDLRATAGAAARDLPAGVQAHIMARAAVGRPLLAPAHAGSSGSGSSVNLDRELDRPLRTRAETVTGAIGIGGTGTSRYFPSTDAGPSRRRRGDDMPLD
ncbi:hypothetical protein HWV62_5624 [Athelia sp. TMB]|nr:hypothetical protein HWV62_5624 [Athelia sp. TMB]